MEIKRRDFNGLIASLALVPLCVGQALEITEEWVVGFDPKMEGFVVKVWSDDSVTAYRGTTQLKPKELF